MKKDSVGQQYVFVDDSGDPGLSKTSSSRFIVAAVIIADRLARDELSLIIDAMRQMATDLRQAIKSRGRSVKLIRFDDSHKNSLIQLADIVAGAVARSYQTSKTDADEYHRLIGSKLRGIYER